MARPTRRPRKLPGDVATARQGLTPAQVEHQLVVQAFSCLICMGPLGQEWAADHDHVLGALHGHPPEKGCQRCFRGFLCKGCNLMLGWSRDRPEVLEAGAQYLRLSRGQ